MSTVPSGWHVCQLCKAYVPDGSTHYCNSQQPTTYTWTAPFTFDQETKDILRRIADALENIAGVNAS